MGNVRVLPLLVFAGVCLFVLKAMGLFLSGGYVFTGTAPASAQNTQADAAQKKPAGKQDKVPQKQESRPEAQQEAAKKKVTPDKSKAAGKAPVESQKAPAESQKAMSGPPGGTTKAELAILEGLGDRRKVLDQRERALGLRENLLKAAEKRVEARINKLKAIESRIEGVLKKHDVRRNAQYERLVKMYSGMKPKDAARIFDRLDLNVLVDLVSQMKPRVMSAILAAMTSSAAERLTLEIAYRGKPKPVAAVSLPKIHSKKSN